jgi:toxin CptA
MPPDGVLSLQLKASRQFAAVLSAAHAVAATMLFLVPLPLALRLGVLLALTLSLRHALRLHAWRTLPGASVGLSVQRDGAARLDLQSGEALTGRVLGSTRVGTLVTVIHLRRDDNGATTSVVLLPGSAEADELRALRVWLRFKIEPA